MNNGRLIGAMARRACLALPLIALFALFPGRASSQAGRMSFKLTTRTEAGFLYGSGSEFIYNQDVQANYKNSELFWPVQPMVYAGAGLSLETNRGFFASLDLRQGIPGKTGTMTDSDFLNGDGAKTHYSESDSYTERAVLVDLLLGYDMPMRGALRVAGYLGFSYMDFKWSARDGYYQYPTNENDYYLNSGGNLVLGTSTPWSAGETKTPLYGTGILYEQAYLIGVLGLRASYRLLPALSLGAAISFSPLAYCYTEDNHEERSIDFFSSLRGGLMVEPRVSLTMAVKQGASLELSIDYRYISNFLGDITMVNVGATSTSSRGNYYAGPDSASSGKNVSGAAFSMLGAGLSLKLAF